MLSTCGEGEVAVTTRTRYGCIMSREYQELLHERWFILTLKEAVLMSYVWPANM